MDDWDFIVPMGGGKPPRPLKDGEVVRVIEFTENSPTLEELQSIVGGYVEMIMLHDGRQMMFNEEGRHRDLPINEAASQIAGFDIAGNVAILTGEAKAK